MVKWFGRGVLALILIAAGVFFGVVPGIVEEGQNRVVAHAPYPVSDEARALHARLTIADWHADSLLWNRNLLKAHDRGHVDFPRLEHGNVALQVFTTVTKSPAGQNYDENSADARDNITLLAIAQAWPIKSWFNLTERGLYMADRMARYADKAPDRVRLIRSVADIDQLLADRAAGARVIGAMMGAEGGHVLEGDLANLARLDAAGFRLIGLTHFFDNALGGSLHGEAGTGLTAFGRAVVAEMVTRQMVIDLAHASPQMARDVLEITEVPVIVSHSGINSHCAVKRNFEDDLMREIAATGGVIGIGYWEDVTCDASPAGVGAAIMAAIEVVGIDHVSLGSDFDGAVETHLDTSELAILTQVLMDNGLSETDIAAVMGGNMLRVLRSVLPAE